MRPAARATIVDASWCSGWLAITSSSLWNVNEFTSPVRVWRLIRSNQQYTGVYCRVTWPCCVQLFVESLFQQSIQHYLSPCQHLEPRTNTAGTSRLPTQYVIIGRVNNAMTSTFDRVPSELDHTPPGLEFIARNTFRWPRLSCSFLWISESPSTLLQSWQSFFLHLHWSWQHKPERDRHWLPVKQRVEYIHIISNLKNVNHISP